MQDKDSVKYSHNNRIQKLHDTTSVQLVLKYVHHLQCLVDATLVIVYSHK